MPVQVSYPGVYVQEIPSGVRTITGVSTSVTMFVGMTTRGRLNVPARVLSFADYQRAFGSDTTISEMTDQVRQFFQNGGQTAFVTRIALNAIAARVELQNDTGATSVLRVFAGDAGLDGNLIRVEVDYDTADPEATFNLRAFRLAPDLSGALNVIETDETFSNLSMDPSSGRYVNSIVNQQSTLIRIQNDDDPGPPAPLVLPAAGTGFSIAGRLLDTVDANALASLQNTITAQRNSFQISVDGRPPVNVVLPSPAAVVPNVQDWQDTINLLLTPVSATVNVTLQLGPTGSRYLRFASENLNGGSVRILPAATNDR